MVKRDRGMSRKRGSSHEGKLPEVDHSCFRWTADLICGVFGSTQERVAVKRRPALDWITSKAAGLASQSGVSSMPPQMEIVEDESHSAGEDRHGSMSLICMAPPDLVLI
jgi:hypothetical protein